jgi:transposase-like protein
VPPRIPDAKRAEILADINAGTKGRNQIARDHDVSVSTVTKIAAEEGATTAFDRSQTKNATAAAVADSRAVRAATARRMLAKANELLDQMDQPHVVFNIGGKDNTYTEHLMDRPPTADLRNLMTCAAIALDKHLAIEKHDGDQGAEAAKSMLGDLAAGLRAVYDASGLAGQ